jgi:hypothetical protein
MTVSGKYIKGWECLAILTFIKFFFLEKMAIDLVSNVFTTASGQDQAGQPTLIKHFIIIKNVFTTALTFYPPIYIFISINEY